jgi:uncharacterized surface protein with fasciclin (FAS1) repeats
MKNFNITKFMMLALLASFTLLFACKKDEEMPQNTGIVGVLQANSDYSLLKSALVRTDLLTVIDGQGPFTLFAPTNAAFIRAGLNADQINTMDKQDLKNILLYHVLNNQVTSSEIAIANNTLVNTAANQNIYVTRNNTGVYVNGATVLNADIKTSNGVIHSIDDVMMPPTSHIWDKIQAHPSYSFLEQAILRAGQGSTMVSQLLSGNGPYTVFAPTNQAFINAGYTTLASIQMEDTEVLGKILKYHVVSGQKLSTDLKDGEKLTTLQLGQVTVSMGATTKIVGSGSTRLASILDPNNLASNGVIHVIDEVLIPNN